MFKHLNYAKSNASGIIPVPLNYFFCQEISKHF